MCIITVNDPYVLYISEVPFKIVILIFRGVIYMYSYLSKRVVKSQITTTITIIAAAIKKQ